MLYTLNSRILLGKRSAPQTYLSTIMFAARNDDPGTAAAPHESQPAPETGTVNNMLSLPSLTSGSGSGTRSGELGTNSIGSHLKVIVPRSSGSEKSFIEVSSS